MDALHLISSRLHAVAGDLAEREAERILLSVVQCRRHELYTSPKYRDLDRAQTGRALAFAEQRAEGRPLEYVLGSSYFHSCELTITSDVLIPRVDTEVLVESVLERHPDRERWFLDVCTGSGAIAAALLANRPHWHGIVADISTPALRVARANTNANCGLVASDLLDAFRLDAHFDFVVCNPPYISSDEFATLDRSVRDFEPKLALDGGPDGLVVYRYLAAHAVRVLRPEGELYVEVGWTQAEAVSALFKERGWQAIEVRDDLAGRPRIVCARNPHAA